VKGTEENIIIVKKGKKHEGHHGGAWKVAYADFVTAMMALFIVLWVLGQDEEVVKSVAGYFQDPIGYSEKMNSILSGTLNLPIDNAETIVEKIKERDKEIERLNDMKDKIMMELSSNQEFEGLVDQIKIQIVKEGLRIEMVESNDAVFFDLGTSELKPQAKKLLDQIGKNLATIDNKIVIEGHTDSRPYGSDGSGYSNFELSVDRANSARRELVGSGLKLERIKEVRGYADTRLLDKNDPYNLVNRRISIVILFDTEEPEIEKSKEEKNQ
jgi:chemotaxis protein MotB